jgi:hypothetical protein
MIRDCKELRDFELRYLRESKTDFQQNIAIYEAMHKLARKLLAGQDIDPLDGIDVDIRVARVVNSV